MTYEYTDDMDALRVTFEDMLTEIDDLERELSEADDAIMELYNEANDLERELRLTREAFDQAMFDAEEDYIDLEQELNALAADYNELYDAATEPVIDPDFDDEQWDLFNVEGILLTHFSPTRN